MPLAALRRWPVASTAWEGWLASASNLSGARPETLLRLMHERPSLRPLAPLLGVLAAMWLAALALLAEHLL